MAKIRFSPNLHHLFKELPPHRRLEAVRKCGCDEVEWHMPFALTKEELKQQLDDLGLEFIYFVVPVDWDKGVWGLGAQPGKEQEFRRAASIALEYAALCDIYSINVGAGPVPKGESKERCIDTYVKNLIWMSEQARGMRLKLLLEGVAAERVPDWAMQTMAEANAIRRATGQDRVQLVFDTYQLRWQEQGPLTPIMDAYWEHIGHIQIGNTPKRFEPGVGEMDLLWLVERAYAKGWQGCVGLEHDPSMDSWSSLMWMNKYGYTVDPKNRPVDS